ncbi:MAG: hypothetical protein HY905_21285 [Deltaproteobacteria bacterium]|nr:hypothetical protein [Deltaproteobacteria bacterium]
MRRMSNDGCLDKQSRLPACCKPGRPRDGSTSHAAGCSASGEPPFPARELAVLARAAIAIWSRATGPARGDGWEREAGSW